MLSKEKCGAMVMLVFSMAYGYQATIMPLTFMAAQESFNSKTLPMGLSLVGVVISFLILVLPPTTEEGRTDFKEAFKGKVWDKTIGLFINMAVYGVAMPFLGFIVASLVFLLVGFYILGERKWGKMIAAAALVVLGVWALLSKVMGIYIAPGEIYYMLGGR